MASGYLKELPLNSPRDFFFSCSFVIQWPTQGLLGSGKSREFWKRKSAVVYGCNGTMQTDLLYQDDAGNPPPGGNSLEGVFGSWDRWYKTILTLIPEGLKIQCTSLGTRYLVSVRDAAWSYGIFFFFSVNLIVSLVSLAMHVTTFPSGFPGHGHLLRL